MSGPVPRVGCGAAIVRDGRLLLVRRLRQPEAGAWNLPGGKVEFREPVADAVVREVREELGVDVALERLLGSAEMIDLGDGQHWVSTFYLARIVRGEPGNCEPDKHAEAAWFPLDRLPQPLAVAARNAAAALAGG